MADLVESMEAARPRTVPASRVQTWHVALRRGPRGIEYIDPGTFSLEPGEPARKARPAKQHPVTRIMEVRITLVREVGAC